MPLQGEGLPVILVRKGIDSGENLVTTESALLESDRRGRIGGVPVTRSPKIGSSSYKQHLIKAAADFGVAASWHVDKDLAFKP